MKLFLISLLFSLVVVALPAEQNQRQISGYTGYIAPMIIVGEGWTVQLVIQNLDKDATAGVLTFYRADGTPWDVPLVSHQTLNGQLPLTLFPGETVIIETKVSFEYQQLGWANLDLNCCGDRLAQIIYRKQAQGRPDLMTSTPFGGANSRATVYFDNTDWKYTGVGVTNANQRFPFGSNESEIDVTIRDAAGNIISQHTRRIGYSQFQWFSLTAEYPETANMKGSISFSQQGSDYARLNAFSLQFAPNGAFTSILCGETF